MNTAMSAAFFITLNETMSERLWATWATAKRDREADNAVAEARLCGPEQQLWQATADQGKVAVTLRRKCGVV